MLNVRQERFVCLNASGKSAAAAYAKAYDRSGHSAEASGSRLLRNVEVQGKLEELRLAASQKTAMSISEAVCRLKAICDTPISELDEDHPLTRRIVTRESKRDGQLVRSVRIVEKDSILGAMQEISRLLGLGQPPEKARQSKKPASLPHGAELQRA